MAASDFGRTGSVPRWMSGSFRLRSLINPFQGEREIEDFGALQELAAESEPTLAPMRRKKSRPNMIAWFTNSMNLSCVSFFQAKTTCECVSHDSLWRGRHGHVIGPICCPDLPTLDQRSDLRSQTVDIQQGEEVGINHRSARDRRVRVRTSSGRAGRAPPGAYFAFDANKRRHTSFASVDVVPEIADTAP